MIDLIRVYLDGNVSDEAKEDIERSFDILINFNFNDIYSTLVDILMQESTVTNDERMDMFYRRIHDMLNEVLNQHSLVLSSDTTLFQKNEITSALYEVQHQEDYEVLTSILMTDEPPEYKLSEIVNELSEIDTSNVMELIESFDPNILKALSEFIENKVKEEADNNIRTAGDRLKIYFEVLGRDNLAMKLLDEGYRPGNEFMLYLSNLTDVSTTSTDELARHISSVLYMSNDGYENPLKTYREHSDELLEDINLISAVEVILIKHIAAISDHIEAAKESLKVQT